MKPILSRTLCSFVTIAMASQNLLAEEPMEPFAKQASSLKEFLSRPALVEAYEKSLQQFLGKSKYSCESFSQVLKRVKVLQTQSPDLAKRLWETTSYFPSLKVEFEQNTFLFRAVSRPFHAFWTDASGEGCPPESCEAPQAVAPTRWATVLPGAQFFWIEKNGSFTGSAVWVLPIKRNGQQYGLVTQVGPALLRPSEDKSILQLWGELAKPHFPKSWSGLVSLVLQSETFPIPMMMEWHSEEFKVLSAAREFEPLENLDVVSKLFPRSCYARSVPLGMEVFYGKTPESTKELWQAKAVPSATDSKSVEEWLLSMNGIPSADWVTKVDSKKRDSYRAAFEILLGKNRHPLVRRRAAIALGDLLNVQGVELPAMRLSRAPSSEVIKSLAKIGNSSQDSSSKDKEAQSIHFLPGKALAPLTRALNDNDKVVQGSAALGLMRQGMQSPQIQNGVADLAGSLWERPFSPGKEDRDLDVPKDDFKNLLSRLPKDGSMTAKVYKKLLDSIDSNPNKEEQVAAETEIARRYYEGGSKSLNELQDLSIKNPTVADQVARIIKDHPIVCNQDVVSNSSGRGTSKYDSNLTLFVPRQANSSHEAIPRVEEDSSKNPTMPAWECRDMLSLKEKAPVSISASPFSLRYVLTQQQGEQLKLATPEDKTAKCEFVFFNFHEGHIELAGRVESRECRDKHTFVMGEQLGPGFGSAIYAFLKNQTPVPTPCNSATVGDVQVCVNNPGGQSNPQSSRSPSVKLIQNNWLELMNMLKVSPESMQKYRGLLTLEQRAKLDLMVGKLFPKLWQLGAAAFNQIQNSSTGLPLPVTLPFPEPEPEPETSSRLPSKAP